mmetsp:Transcript_17617/g.38168  ORF Transcript_17617/g.38168 Transcript_17617/m.38168 type:complete len:223 (+) Transcript_17617:805-1473(+)
MIVSKGEVPLFRRHRVMDQAEHHLIEAEDAVGRRAVAARPALLGTPHERGDRRAHHRQAFLFGRYVDIDADATAAVSVVLAIPARRRRGGRSARLRSRVPDRRLLEPGYVLGHYLLGGEHQPRHDQRPGHEEKEDRGDLPRAAVLTRGGSDHQSAVLQLMPVLLGGGGLGNRRRVPTAVRAHPRGGVVGVGAMRVDGRVARRGHDHLPSDDADIYRVTAFSQ